MEKSVLPALLGEPLLKVYAELLPAPPTCFRILFLSGLPENQAKVSEELTGRCIESGMMFLDIVAGEFRRVDPWGTTVILIVDQDSHYPEWICLTLETLLKRGPDLSPRGIRAIAPSEKG